MSLMIPKMAIMRISAAKKIVVVSQISIVLSHGCERYVAPILVLTWTKIESTPGRTPHRLRRIKRREAKIADIVNDNNTQTANSPDRNFLSLGTNRTIASISIRASMGIYAKNQSH